jgi:hypothetical protein
VGLRAFHERWGAIAATAWSTVQLYGLDPVSRPTPGSGAWGAPFSHACGAHRVISVDANAITMATRTSARLRVYRGEIDPGAMLAWSIGVAG